MKKHNAAIYILSSRVWALKFSLKHLYWAFNKYHDYPIYIYHFDDIYSEEYIADIHNTVSKNIHFIQVDYGVPKHIPEEDLFYNKTDLLYVKSQRFEKSRIGFLYMCDFVSNIHKHEELKQYDYVMRLDDDSLFIKDFEESDLFDSLDPSQEGSGPFATGITWSNTALETLETRVGLFSLVKEYVKKYNIQVKNDQLREAIEEDNERKMHKLMWSCGNLNMYNIQQFLDHGWLNWIDMVNKSGGCYKHRWGDIEVIGLFAYMHFDVPLVDLELKKTGKYLDKCNNTLGDMSHILTYFVQNTDPVAVYKYMKFIGALDCLKEDEDGKYWDLKEVIVPRASIFSYAPPPVKWLSGNIHKEEKEL
jgi:hypothetical protein